MWPEAMAISRQHSVKVVLPDLPAATGIVESAPFHDPSAALMQKSTEKINEDNVEKKETKSDGKWSADWTVTNNQIMIYYTFTCVNVCDACSMYVFIYIYIYICYLKFKNNAL